MKGHKFLKVTGILMIIAAVFSIIAGVLVGGLGYGGISPPLAARPDPL